MRTTVIELLKTGRDGDAAIGATSDAVLMAVCFAMPHDKPGEDIAACVVLREGAEASERELREHCARRLADFKVPRKVLLVAEIPKGATGKPQRIGLAQKLGLG